MERAKSNIPVDQLTTYLFESPFLETKRKILKILESEKLFDKSKNYFSGRVERFEVALARAKRLRQLAVEHEWALEDHNIAVDLLSEPMPYGLHGTMFLVSHTFLHMLEMLSNQTVTSSLSSTNATIDKDPSTL